MAATATTGHAALATAAVDPLCSRTMASSEPIVFWPAR